MSAKKIPTRYNKVKRNVLLINKLRRWKQELNKH